MTNSAQQLDRERERLAAAYLRLRTPGTPLEMPVHRIYTEYKPQKRNRAMLGHVQDIIDKEAKSGLKLTLRGVHYKLVKANLTPNTKKQYKALGELIKDARWGGWLRMTCVQDRGRQLSEDLGFADLDQFMTSVPYWFDQSHWLHQTRYVEVWTEKETLLDVVAMACETTSTAYMATRGYISTTATYRSASRFKQRIADRAQFTTILHISDHDASGLHMTENLRKDLVDRLEVEGLDIHRIALTRAQVDQFDCPPNWAKEKDTRSRAYIPVHGPHSWELEALDSMDLVNIVRAAIRPFVDQDVVARANEHVSEQRDLVRGFFADWPEYLANHE